MSERRGSHVGVATAHAHVDEVERALACHSWGAEAARTSLACVPGDRFARATVDRGQESRRCRTVSGCPHSAQAASLA